MTDEGGTTLTLENTKTTGSDPQSSPKGEGIDNKPKPKNLCAKCAKLATMKCSRCLVNLTTHYCSRECQKADWKSHKKVCGKANKAEKEDLCSGFISFEDYMKEDKNINMFSDPITSMLNDGVLEGDGLFMDEMERAMEEAIEEEGIQTKISRKGIVE